MKNKQSVNKAKAFAADRDSTTYKAPKPTKKKAKSKKK